SDTTSRLSRACSRASASVATRPGSTNHPPSSASSSSEADRSSTKGSTSEADACPPDGCPLYGCPPWGECGGHFRAPADEEPEKLETVELPDKLETVELPEKLLRPRATSGGGTVPIRSWSASACPTSAQARAPSTSTHGSFWLSRSPRSSASSRLRAMGPPAASRLPASSCRTRKKGRTPPRPPPSRSTPAAREPLPSMPESQARTGC